MAEETPVLTAPPPSDYIAEVSFEELALSEEVKMAIRERGYKSPTPVQAKSIPLVLSGKDLIVRSKTGTGKTAAFGIPMIEKLPAGARCAKAIVLCPTRELAIQVADELASLAKHKDLRVTCIYGGAPMGKQIDALKDGAEIIVGTPGRVYDHIRRKNLDLSKAEMGVLDEADEMLNQGFYEEVTRILEHLPASRQMMLFSATTPPDIERLIKRFTKDPETIYLSGDTFTVEGIENILYYTVDAYPKPRNLLYLLHLEEPDAAIVFCNTRDDTSLVTAVLNRNGFDAEVLNGDLPQKERERVMGRIKKGELSYLVATDIAARGIDISDLSHVINYSLPEDPAVYVHRVGRTGRIGKKGTAISLISGRELVTLTALEKKFGIKFEERKLPTPEEAKKQWFERHLKEIKEGMKGSVHEAMISVAQDVKAHPEGDQIFAYLLKYFFTHSRMERVQAEHDRLGVAPKITEDDREPRPERERPPRREARAERPPRDEKPREERPPREEKPREEKKVEPDPRGAKLWVNLGTADGVDAEVVADTLVKFAGVEREKIKGIEVKVTHSYVFVEDAMVETFTKVTGQERSGKKVRVEPPRAPRSR